MTLLKLFAVFLGILNLASASTATLENLDVIQTVDVISTYLRQSFDIKVVNTGAEKARSYIFILPEERASELAVMTSRNVETNLLDIKKIKTPVSGYEAYEIFFDTPIEPEAEYQFGVYLAFSSAQPPLPATGLQQDVQMLLYTGSKTYPSIYGTHIQELQFNAVTENCETIEDDGTRTPAAYGSTGYVSFGPFEAVEPLEVVPLKFRYENPLPQTQVQKLDRKIWVSHWGGSVSFDESYDVKNTGTKLTKSFDRVKFSGPRAGFSLNTAAKLSFEIALPKTHREEYYVDLVGNVSTSAVREDSLEIGPRYPLMGGWFYNFTVGWAADLGEFVRKASTGNYVLKVPLVGGPEQIGYRSVTNKIILPEGAKLGEVLSEVPYTNSSETLTYSYLDLYGRPSVQLQYDNIVSEQREKFIYVSYSYNTLIALKKPISYAVLTFAVGLSLKIATFCYGL